MADGEFQGRVAIVTGGARGIGRAISLTLARGGASVVIADINRGAAEETAAAIGEGRALVAQTDVASEDSIERLFSLTMGKLGRLDVVVSNAGILKNTDPLDTTAAEWDHIMAVNLRGTFLTCREAVRVMRSRGSGRIVNMASTAGKTGGTMGGIHYAASKAGIISLTKSFAKYAAPYKINVNAVSPGPIETDLTKAWGEELNADLAETIPWKEYGKPEDVAEAVAFLASDRARYITGEILDVNGGFVMD